MERSLWVWYLSQCFGGDIGKLLAACKSAGITRLKVKAHEGGQETDNAGYNFMDQLARCVQPCKDAGVALDSWGFNYFDNLNEPTLISKALGMSDRYCFDAESPIDGKSAAAKWYLAAVRSANPHAELSYAAYAFPSMHADFPWAEFDAVCDYAEPQIYFLAFGQSGVEWSGRNWNARAALLRCLSDYAQLGLHSDIRPTLQAYGGAQPVDVLEIEGWARGQALEGVSYWSAQHLTPEIWKALGDNLWYVKGAPWQPAPAAPGSTQAVSGSNDPPEPVNVQSQGSPEGSSSAWDPAAEITSLQKRGLIENPHAPDDPVSWGQFATVLNRLKGGG